MNKIIVVGHPQSDYEQVLHFLLECGMAPALPLQRDNLVPEQISATLIKAHGAVPVDQVQTSAQLQQIQVAAVWQGMVLDLMLSNLDQPLWGWADPQAVYLLDYWKEQDPQVVFVLVYDEPQTVYTRPALEHATASQEELQRRMDAWVAYNAALLHFHLRNPQRSVLVHARQVQPSARSYLQQLSERIAAPLQLPSNQVSPQDQVPAQVAAPPTPAAAAGLPRNAQVDLLVNLLVDAHPKAQTLYEELQAAASLPLSMGGAQPASRGALVPYGAGLQQACYQAWQACVAQYQMLADNAKVQQALQTQVEQHIGAEIDLRTELQAAQNQAQQWASKQREENDLLQVQLHKTQEELEHLHLEGQKQEQELHAQIKQHIEAEAELQTQWQAAQAQAKQSASAQQEESNLLITQLHKVQEELEGLYRRGQKQEQELQTQVKQQSQAQAKLKAQEQTAQAQAKQLASVQAELQKTQAGLNAAQRKAASAELQQENTLLLEQLHKAQEELERYYLENRKLKADQPKAYYGAADRVKQQLAYQLGATMIAQSRSFGGWLSMPFALRVQAKRFRQDQSAQQELPPIAQYRDADKAERVKQHLSYRLGARWLANAKSLGGWISMPWALYAEVKDFRKKRA